MSPLLLLFIMQLRSTVRPLTGMLNKIYSKIEGYVISFFESNSKPELTYHNLHHTTTVVKRSGEIAAHYTLTASDKLVLYAAAWFHDTGYLVGDVFGHEERSVA